MSITSENPVRRGRKFEQVLEGALRIFQRDGFEGASVDDIAREAGVSKATLYSYFPDKRIMFTESLSTECRRQAIGSVELDLDNMSLRAVLNFVAQRVVDYNSSDFALRLSTLIVGEVSRFPAIAREFYANGPAKLRQRLVQDLRALEHRGDLEIKPDGFDLAADQFVQLCGAMIDERLRLGLLADIRPEEIRQTIEGAIEMFIARYGIQD